MDLEITLTLTQCLSWIGLSALILLIMFVMFLLFYDDGRIK